MIFKRKRELSRSELGRLGERVAEKFLRRKGFKKASRNLRLCAGEIDLLMWDRETLVIIEVRTVQECDSNSLEMKIAYRKRIKIIELSRILESSLPDPLPDIRIDFCLVEYGKSIKVNHYPDAFDMDNYKN